MSRSFFNTPINFSVSQLCIPMDGSSRMYNEPTSEEPKEVVRFMRWLSPPERVLLGRLRVR